ncbi:WcaI family glycosyltransferase [Mucilaginibacter lacusdianchii]|uniref:WcaI family glycosyltransferase n=1 Tax=Mucilaginibacter lacusdianchii TaxID=2684211 RepID=UPI00131BA56E|nr:WcaI family glycosyltransferase [Mucilaginibacter sp. JXJ CY 39]
MKTVNAEKKRVLLMGINFAPELTGIGKYTGEMVDWLTENDYDCTVVTSFPYYPYWKTQSPYSGRTYKKEVSNDGSVTVYRCPMYVPAQPTGAKRIIHELTFCITSFFVILSLLFKPRHDYIFCMAPPFILGYLGLFYRFFKGGKLIYHIHDMEIEAARDLGILRFDALFKMLFTIERYILNHCDVLTTVSLGMRKKIMQKTFKPVKYFPNWVNFENFWPLQNDSAYKNEWGFDADDKVVLYSGSLGEKQGLDSLISIAKRLEFEPRIKFLICGNGPYKEALVQLATENNVSNVFFLPFQEMDVFNKFLNMADVHLVIQKKNASDLMMPSKLTNILAVGGLALVTADPGTHLYELINEYDMGVIVPAENEDALTESILECCSMDNKLQKINAIEYANTYLSRDSILKQVLRDIGEELPSTETPLHHMPVA